MKIASIADVKANLSAYVRASSEELVIITRNGKRLRYYYQWTMRPN